MLDILITGAEIDEHKNPLYRGQLNYNCFGIALEAAPSHIKKKIEEEFEDYPEYIKIQVIDDPKRPFMVEFEARHLQKPFIDPETGEGRFMTRDEKAKYARIHR